jgi:hypothetical protein
VTRAFGPQLGWINGWAIFLADIIGMAQERAQLRARRAGPARWRQAADPAVLAADARGQP